MVREKVNTRVELDRETDTDLRKIAHAELRHSKREMASVILTRVARIWRESPETLRQARIVY